MADFRRGIKAGVIAGAIYMAIGAILGAVYQYDIHSMPRLLFGSGLNLFTLQSLTDPSFVASLLLRSNLVRGIVFGAIFAALYGLLPGRGGVGKGVVLAAFLCVVAIVGTIYMTPGWTDQVSYGFYYSGSIDLSSPLMGFVGIVSALAFGALAGLLWDRFRGKELIGERSGESPLLLSFILGLVIWVVLAVTFLIRVVFAGFPTIQPEFWWSDLLGMLVVFLGLPGWILARAAWKRIELNRSGYGWAVAGGIMMALTGILWLPGVLAVTGAVFSRGQTVGASAAAGIGQQL